MPADNTPIRVAVLTISDSAASGQRQDISGPAIVTRCAELAWTVVATAIVPDDPDPIAQRLRDWTQTDLATVILTTGGTGITARDVTPEATRRVIEKELPGVAELMRQRGLEQTPFSVLSRAVVGTCGRTLMVNLPGSPRGAVFSLGVVEHLVQHIVRLLAGHTEHADSDTRNSDG